MQIRKTSNLGVLCVVAELPQLDSESVLHLWVLRELDEKPLHNVLSPQKTPKEGQRTVRLAAVVSKPEKSHVFCR